MGLCKCPKKKVTNLFCFEHRVNVCEHCLVSNHPKCIVQSYLQWLQDSDYDPRCRLCEQNLSDDQIGECVRLVCYDVFHWACLNQYAKQLPANTAPAGYTCPACWQCIFPAPNLASPVAETLRDQLSKVNWARAGLGMPLITEATLNAETVSFQEDVSSVLHIDTQEKPTDREPGARAPPHETMSQQQHSIINVDEPAVYARALDKQSDQASGSGNRKLFDIRHDGEQSVSHDHDEDKYRRRPAVQWLSRWFQSQTSKRSKDPDATLKRFIIFLVIGLVGFFTVIVIFSRVGRSMADYDPLLDPKANPNIRVGDNFPIGKNSLLGNLQAKDS